MTEQHVTKIDDDLDDDLDPDTPTGYRYQPRCSCGWVGVPDFDRKRAAKAADMHRMKEAVDAL